MCESETAISDIEAFVQLLGRVRGPLEALYRDEMQRMQRDADAADRDEEQTSFEIM
jgi:hypothetical protein